MALYEVIREGDQVLRDKAKKVPKITPNILKLLDNMADTMYANKGVGLAAPQIGISKRVIVVDTGSGLIELINPEIMEMEGSQTGLEGCLSFPQVFGEVTRALKVVVKGMKRDGKIVEVKAKGYTARALQHEFDHLEGILFIDKATNLRKEENA